MQSRFQPEGRSVDRRDAAQLIEEVEQQDLVWTNV
jgi:hypothetical protein